MNYISVSEASRRWGVSARQVQRLLAEGRIPRARKYERSWMIPADADKPTGLRGEKWEPEQALAADLAAVIAATAGPMPADNPDAILNTLAEDRLRLQYEAELAYLRGDFHRIMRCFARTEGDDAARLRACPVAIAAAVTLGDYPAYTQIEAYLKEKAALGGSIAAIAELSLATAAVSVFAPSMVPPWLKDGDFSALPPEARPNACYLRVKYFYCLGQYEPMLVAAETALALASTEGGCTVTDINLPLTCAIACHNLGRPADAERWLLYALNRALPHGFITPFAEQVTALGGLLERCLESAFPAFQHAVLAQWERTWKNWISFHNQFARANITLVLSLREYHIAVQVARRVPYAKIAEQQGISVGRLKNIMRGVYEKLFISGRKELSQYVF